MTEPIYSQNRTRRAYNQKNVILYVKTNTVSTFILYYYIINIVNQPQRIEKKPKIHFNTLSESTLR